MMQAYRGFVLYCCVLAQFCLQAMDDASHVVILGTAASVNSSENTWLIDELLADIAQKRQVSITEASSEKVHNLDNVYEFSFQPTSVFKQQLLYHNRLPINVAKQEIVTDEKGVDELRLVALNRLVKQLLSVVSKKSEAAKSSSWILKGEVHSYILHPLHLAIKHGLYECVKVLLSEGANANAPDHLGKQPLHLVALLEDETVQQKMTSCLMYYNAVLDAPTKMGDTMLTLAIGEGKDAFVDFLLDRGADPNVHVAAEARGTKSVYVCGSSPLWVAVTRKNVVAIGLLLRKKATIKAVERQAVQLMYDIEQDPNYKVLLGKVLATLFHH